MLHIKCQEFWINNKSKNNTSKNIRHPGHLDTPIGVCPCLSGLGMSTDMVDMSAICPVRPGVLSDKTSLMSWPPKTVPLFVD